MPGQAECAILFADIAGSTQLYETLGDARARAVVARCIDAMTEVTHRHGGTLVKTIGDEVMATFPSADAAVAAAADMQDAITGQAVVEGRRLAIRVGLHFGPVLVEEADVFGDAVNVASRMANQAKAAQVLTTGATVAATSDQWRSACRLVDRVAVKGKREPIEVFELVWKAEDSTLMRHAPLLARPATGGRLVLTAGGSRLELTDDHPTVTIGRGDQNDLVVAAAIVSRLHARAEYRNGRFVLTDQSANGTFVVPDGGASTYLHRDSLVLAGAGVLGLGEAPTAGAATALRYEVVGAAAADPVR